MNPKLPTEAESWRDFACGGKENEELARIWTIELLGIVDAL